MFLKVLTNFAEIEPEELGFMVGYYGLYAVTAMTSISPLKYVGRKSIGLGKKSFSIVQNFAVDHTIDPKNLPILSKNLFDCLPYID